MHMSCKHPDPHIGGDDIEGHLSRVIPYTHWLLENQLPSDCEDQANRAAMLHLLADSYQVRYRRNNCHEDLLQALALCEEAIFALPSDDDENVLKEILGHLAELQYHKYQESRSTDDLERGITWAEQAVAATPPNTPHRYYHTSFLANLLHDLYIRNGNPHLLNQSISLTHENANHVHPGEQSSLTMNLLANRLQERHELTGAMSDLQQATMYAQKVVDETDKDDPEYGIRLSNLGNKHHSRYLRSNDESHLDIAIQLAKQALQTNLSESYARTVHLCLGSRFHLKFDRSNNIADIDQAIVYTERAVNNMPLTDPNGPLCLFNLGNQYLSRFEAKNDLEDVTIRDARPSASNTRLMNFLVTSVESRHQNLNIKDLDNAIDYYKRALGSLPVDHVGRARMLLITGRALESRYRRMFMLADLEDAIAFYTEACNYRIARPLERIDGARKAAELHALQKYWTEATSCMTAALDLLPMVSPRTLQRDDQQHVLAKFSGLAAEAASFALEAGYPAYEALRLLELGRGMIMSFAIDLRSDFSSLKTTHPDLFRKFNDLRTKINERSPNLEDPSGTEFSWDPKSMDSVTRKMMDRRGMQDLYEELEGVIVEIRAMDNFHGFLLPPSETEMMSLAKDGAIVVLNSTILRSDALIVTGSSIRALRLPDLAYEDIEVNINRMNAIFEGTCNETRADDNKELSAMLLWLWDVAVNPVCQALGLESKQDTKSAMRIWWIGVGPLSRAPFHAAGKHPSKSKNAVSLVSSSYIPTIKALSYARQDASPRNGISDVRIELVSMPDTPGHPPLPNVEDELSCISEIARKSTVAIDTFVKPSKSQILQRLRRSSGEGVMRIIHFACHGLSDPQNPLESHVLLLKDAEDAEKHSDELIAPQADRLSVREVSTMKVESAYLAYLGACHTANNSVMKLADEGLHIVSSFQLAGFRNVIGNMWKADDESCQIFSREFYCYLLGTDHKKKKGIDAPAAFHHAIKKVRKNAPADFIGWIPFVHSGA